MLGSQLRFSSKWIDLTSSVLWLPGASLGDWARGYEDKHKDSIVTTLGIHFFCPSKHQVDDA